MKGMTSQEAEGWWSLIGDFRHLRYQFFPFFNFPYWYKTATFCVEFFQRYSQFSKSHCLLPLKYQIFFQLLLHQRSGHPTYTSHPIYSSHPIHPVYPSQASSPNRPFHFSHPSHFCHPSVPGHLSCPVISVILVRNMVKFTVSSKHETLLSLYGCKKYKESLNKDKI